MHASQASARTAPHVLTLILITGLSVLSTNMFLPSLGQISVGLGAPYALVSLSVGGYLAVSAGLQLIMGPLSDLIGRRPVLIGGLVLFTVASVGCALAGNIWIFLGFRLLQGGIAAGMALSRAVVRDLHSPDEAARLLGVIGMAMALAPILGPVLGGALDELFGWRANFVAFTLMGAVMLVIVWRDLGETNLTPSSSFIAQFRTYPELFRNPLFWSYCGLIAFSVGGFYAFLGGAPQVGAALYGLSPAWLGAGMGSISAGFMLGNYLTGRFAGRLGALRIMLLGRLVAVAGPALALIAIAAGLSSPFTLFAGAIAVGLGNGLTLPNANAGVMSVNPRLAGSASGLSAALTVAGGAVFTTVSATLSVGAHGDLWLLACLVVTSAGGLWAAVLTGRLEGRR